MVFDLGRGFGMQHQPANRVHIGDRNQKPSSRGEQPATRRKSRDDFNRVSQMFEDMAGIDFRNTLIREPAEVAEVADNVHVRPGLGIQDGPALLRVCPPI